MQKNKLTYISLFSGAGIGCEGFKLAGYECIATNEFLDKRLNIQKINNKCKYNSGYIKGDITSEDIKNKIFNEIDFWKKNENIHNVDVIVSTPPCQGMSIANNKKTKTEFVRNSLFLESVKMIIKIKPKIFIFENVPSFMNSTCLDLEQNFMKIGDVIEKYLSDSYSIFHKTINFKNYGSNSSRKRTIVIGVRNDYAIYFSPIQLFPEYQKEKTLKEVIGHLRSLKYFNEVDPNDPLHSFRNYRNDMRNWISDLKEGQSAFNNKDPLKKPHRIIDNKIVYNKNLNGDKYKRQIWNKTSPCIHTRNDQLASQNTIHPKDDRVFSIRELMLLMNIPDYYRWSEHDLSILNKMCIEEKLAILKKIDINTRQSIGESVPTSIFGSIANKIKKFLLKKDAKSNEINNLIKKNNLENIDNFILFINQNFDKYHIYTFQKIFEITSLNRKSTGSYYTNYSTATEISKTWPYNILKNKIRILEPSVGLGNFLPLIFKVFESYDNVILDCVDINLNALKILKNIISKIEKPKNFVINYINEDFLTYKFNVKYDLIIGNPPFLKLKLSESKLSLYRKKAYNKKTNNIFAFFIEKSLEIGNFISFVLPKTLLNTPEFNMTRELLSPKKITHIIDFGEKAFKDALIETICLNIYPNLKRRLTKIISSHNRINIIQKQNYVCDSRLPYWIIYRNNYFDNVLNTMEFNIFNVFRDRQINKSMLKEKGDIKILKSKNLLDNGKIDDTIKAYINREEAQKLSVYRYLNSKFLYLTPNMTYKPRVVKKPDKILVNGSLAILIPKSNIQLSEDDMLFFTTRNYREFYRIARNYQTRSLNVDSNSVFFFGKKIN